MKGRSISYSPEELAWIEANKALPRRRLHEAFVAAFGRKDVSEKNLTALCKRRGWMTGRTGRFAKGAEPHNKGRPYSPVGSEKGWFRKGHKSGRAVQIEKPVGHERVSKDGYLERKVNNDLPFRKRWRAVHLIRWEEANGPVPEGHALKCLDGDKTNTDPGNWTAIPRAMLPRLSGRFGRNYDRADAELKPAIMAIVKLEHRAREIRKPSHKEEEDAA